MPTGRFPRTGCEGFLSGDRVHTGNCTMLTSRLRSCLHIDFFGNNLRPSIMPPAIKWGLMVLGLTISATQAKAEYRVDIGAELEVAEAGVPGLRQRAAVQMDGDISLPLVGMLPVAGLPLPLIRARIGAALASKVFRQRTPDGHETAIVIDADEVTATVAEYRPIYVNGDVSKPGEYPYRPSTTARQVVALAGGY